MGSKDASLTITVFAIRETEDRQDPCPSLFFYLLVFFVLSMLINIAYARLPPSVFDFRRRFFLSHSKRMSSHFDDMDFDERWETKDKAPSI